MLNEIASEYCGISDVVNELVKAVPTSKLLDICKRLNNEYEMGIIYFEDNWLENHKDDICQYVLDQLEVWAEDAYQEIIEDIPSLADCDLYEALKENNPNLKTWFKERVEELINDDVMDYILGDIDEIPYVFDIPDDEEILQGIYDVMIEILQTNDIVDMLKNKEIKNFPTSIKRFKNIEFIGGNDTQNIVDVTNDTTTNTNHTSMQLSHTSVTDDDLL